MNNNRCLRWIRNLLQLNLWSHFSFALKCQKSAVLVLRQNAQKNPSCVNFTSTVLMEWPWLARISRTPWTRLFIQKQDIQISHTHFWGCFEQKSLLWALRHNCLDIFESISSASEPGTIRWLASDGWYSAVTQQGNHFRVFLWMLKYDIFCWYLSG